MTEQKCPSVVTIGNFDGVHLGHQQLVRKTIADARESGFLSRVVTFHPHPMLILKKPGKEYIALCSPEKRIALLRALGADAVNVIPFSAPLAVLSARNFAQTLVEKFAVRKLVIGHDFKMGCDRAGEEELGKIGEELGFSVESVSAVAEPVSGVTVSSSRIRAALAEGDVAFAAAMLGRKYCLLGEVVHGAGRGGPVLGFPTANLHAEPTIIPKNGTYATTVRLLEGDNAGKIFPSVTNIGNNPTFDGQSRSVETYLLDFSDDLYGMQMEVSFDAPLRAERRFDSIAELKKQISDDVLSRRSIADTTTL